MLSGKLDITATALDQIHHGAGTAGNTQLLRTQDIILPDGRDARVPFVSGNSLKHMIRDGAARFAVEVMGLGDDSSSKGLVDLLFSGGHLSKGGSTVDLARARAIAELFPMLSLCGYSAGNFIQKSKLCVENLHLVCEENEWRVPKRLQGSPLVAKRAGFFRAENFGTRHEATKDPSVSKFLTASALKGDGKSSQMIYDFEVVKPGAVFWGAYSFMDLTAMEFAALRSALVRGCIGRRADGAPIYPVGAKSAIGLGRMAFQFDADEGAAALVSGAGSTGLATYVAHLRDNKGDILNLLEGAL